MAIEITGVWAFLDPPHTLLMNVNSLEAFPV